MTQNHRYKQFTTYDFVYLNPLCSKKHEYVSIVSFDLVMSKDNLSSFSPPDEVDVSCSHKLSCVRWWINQFQSQFHSSHGQWVCLVMRGMPEAKCSRFPSFSGDQQFCDNLSSKHTSLNISPPWHPMRSSTGKVLHLSLPQGFPSWE